MEDYRKRVIDQTIIESLDAFGAVLIVGPKFCGKTTTAERFCKSSVHFQKDDNKEAEIETARINPKLLLKGAKPRLFDEWQDAYEIWDAIRGDCDEKKHETGLYMLTGSTSKKVKTKHTGTGRITTVEMLPMSLYESGESNGSVSLKKMFDSGIEQDFGVQSELSIENLIFAACRGGWPETLYRKTDKAKLAIAKDYVRQIYERDMFQVDEVKRSSKTMKTILWTYARNISTLAKETNMVADVSANFGSITVQTFEDYLDVLKRLHIVCDLDAWCPAIRSKSAIRSGRKREVVDPSIVVGALGLSPEYFYTDLKTFGFIFETLAIRDLKVYSSNFGGNISYYHDRYGLEADAVLHLEDGRYALLEFKLGGNEIELGAKHLCEIEALVKKANETEQQMKIRLPSFKAVITGGQYGYRRADGVYVIPIGCLKD